MTLSRKNYKKPAPKWFTKLRKAVTLLQNSAVVLLLAAGYAAESFTILCIRTSVSAVMNTLEIFLADETNE